MSDSDLKSLSDEDLLDRGLTCQLTGNFQAALVAFTELIRRRPEEEAAFVQLCQSLIKLGRYEKALPFLDKGLSLHPESRKLRYIKGVLSYTVGRLQDAERELKKAHEISPNDADVLVALSMVYLHTHREALAATFLRAALDLDPEHGLAQHLLGTVLLHLDQPEEAMQMLSKAIETFEAVTAVSEEYVDGLFCAGSAMLMVGKTQEGIEHLERAVDLLERGEDPATHLAQFFPVEDLYDTLAAAYMKCQKMEKAKEIAAKRQREE